MAEPTAPATQDHRAPLLRDAAIAIVRRVPPKVRAEETDEEALAREATGEDVVEIAISSEVAVARHEWLGWDTCREFDEILLHGEGDVDLSYARDGLPLFVNHSSWDMVGLVEDVRLDADRVLRGRVRFSKSQRGQEIERDIRDGIRKKISVGYDYAKDSYTEETANGRTVRKVRMWRPMETSSVPIPADYEVGVGRSMRPGARRPDDSPGNAAPKAKEIRMGTSATPAPAGADHEKEREKEKTERKEISILARQHGLTEKLPAWIEGGATLEQVRNEILEHHQKRSAEVLRAGGEKGVLQLSDKEEKQYSLVRAIMGAAGRKRTGFEFELSAEIAKRLGKPENETGLWVPTNMKRQVGTHRGTRAAPLAVGTSAGGQELKFTEYGGFINLLRNRTRVIQMGARVLSGLHGDVGFVTQTSANPFVWGAETSNPTATAFGTGIRTMAPKVGAAMSSYTRQLLAQSVESVEDLVWDDLAQICAIAIDAAAIQGLGASSQPTGIIYTTGTGAVTIGTAGGALTFAHLVGLETEITTDNADISAMGLLTTPGVAGQLKQTQQFSGTNGIPIWTGTVHDGLVNGYKAAITKQVPSDLTKGSNTGTLHAAVFGCWDQLYVGEWGAMEMIVDPYSSAPTQIKVSTMVMIDIFLRYIESFATCEEVVVS